MEVGLVVLWWLLYLALLLAGWPLASAVLPEGTFRGPWLALPLSLTVLTIPIYWIGLVSFGIGTILVCLVFLLLVSAAVARWQSFEPEWTAAAEVIVVFTVAFAFLISIQAAAIGIYAGGGEKFLDFGLLQTLLRSTSLPPEDMWFAGEPVIYYYGGHLVAAVLAKVTSTPGRFAYSLALSGYYAISVTAVYGLARSIATHRDVQPKAAGAVAAFMWGFASNLLTPARVAANVIPKPFRDDVFARLTATVGEFGEYGPESLTTTPADFSYWSASRVIPNTINEFPLFAYRNGDLHAHMMSVVFTLGVAGVLYGYYHTDESRVWRRRALVFGVVPPLGALVIFVNTWSYPTVLGLTVLTVAAADAAPESLFGSRIEGVLTPGAGRNGRIREEVQRPILAVVVAGLVGVIAGFWMSHFVGGTLLAGAGDRGLAFLPDRSGIGPFVLVHGAFLAVLSLYLGGRLSGGSRRAAGMVALAPVLVFLGWKLDLAAVALVGPLLVVGWYLVRQSRLGYDGVMVVAGAGLVILVEFVYLSDNAAPTRFNTVFKTYMVVWTVWSIAAGVAMAWIVERSPSTLPMSPERRAQIGRVFVAVLLVSVSLYGAFALQNHYGDADDYTLDGYEVLYDHHPEEAAAVEWLAERRGQPTIVDAPGYTPYSWENPASSLTGIPTVAGWIHESIYRGDEAYHDRATDVEFVFSTNDARSRAALLKRYDVEYIYYGPRERERFGEHDYASEPGIDVAFRGDEVTIYRVTEDDLVE